MSDPTPQDPIAVVGCRVNDSDFQPLAEQIAFTADCEICAEPTYFGHASKGIIALYGDDSVQTWCAECLLDKATPSDEVEEAGETLARLAKQS